MELLNIKMNLQLKLNKIVLFSYLSGTKDHEISLKQRNIKADFIQILPNTGDQNLSKEKSQSKRIYKLIAFEKNLRETAYRTFLSENFDDDFFNNTDMTGPFFLHVLYDPLTDNPLMSARSFSTPEDIITELGGADKDLLLYDHGHGRRRKVNTGTFVKSIHEGGFIVDRISQQLRNKPGVKKYREFLYCLLFRSIYIAHKGLRYVFALVRTSNSEMLLSRYIPLGLNIIGKTYYKVGESEREHWILQGDLFRIRKQLPLKIQFLKEIYK